MVRSPWPARLTFDFHHAERQKQRSATCRPRRAHADPLPSKSLAYCRVTAFQSAGMPCSLIEIPPASRFVDADRAEAVPHCGRSANTPVACCVEKFFRSTRRHQVDARRSATFVSTLHEARPRRVAPCCVWHESCLQTAAYTLHKSIRRGQRICLCWDSVGQKAWQARWAHCKEPIELQLSQLTFQTSHLESWEVES